MTSTWQEWCKRIEADFRTELLAIEKGYYCRLAEIAARTPPRVGKQPQSAQIIRLDDFRKKRRN